MQLATHFYLFVSLFFLASYVVPSSQQSLCIHTYQNQVSACNEYVANGTLIYIPPSYTYQSFIDELQSNVSMISSAPTAACRPYLYRLACLVGLKNCREVASTPFGSPVCKPVCTDSYNPCRIEYQFRPPPNCEAVDAATGVPDYISPDSTYTFTRNGSSLTVDCKNEVLQTVDDSDVTCEYPLGKSKITNSCGPLCPDPMFTISEYRAADTAGKVFGWATFFFSLIVFVTFLLDSRRREWPNCIPYLMLFSAGVQNIFVVIVPTFANIGKEFYGHWCASEVDVMSQGQPQSGVCTLQGITLIYAATHVNLFAFFWCALVLSRLFFPMKQKLSQFRPFGPIICVAIYGLPFIPVIIGLAVQRIGYARGSGLCTAIVSENPEEKNPSKWLGAVIIYPAMIISSFILIQLGVIIVKLYLAFRQIQSIKVTGSKSGFQYEKRMIIMLIWVLMQQIPAFAFYFNSIETQPRLTQAYASWVSCFLSGGTQRECRLSFRPSYPLLVMSVICGTSYGLIGSIAFGIHNHVWEFWKNYLYSRIRSSKSTVVSAENTGKEDSSSHPHHHNSRGDGNSIELSVQNSGSADDIFIQHRSANNTTTTHDDSNNNNNNINDDDDDVVDDDIHEDS